MPQIRLQQLRLVEEVHFQREQGLGKIVLARDSSGQDFAVRVMDYQITDLLLEDIRREVTQLNAIAVPNVVKIKGMHQEENRFYLITNYYANNSLLEMVQNDARMSAQISRLNLNKNLSEIGDEQVLASKGSDRLQAKQRIAKDLAATMHQLHTHNPPVYHGHLTPSNVLLDARNNIFIADLGLDTLRKTASFKWSYTNKSYYTAPEHFANKSKVITSEQVGAASDVYSYAFILYELFMGKQPFRNYKMKQLISIIENDQRPKINEDIVPFDVATIIRACWKKNPNERPDFGQILQYLDNPPTSPTSYKSYDY